MLSILSTPSKYRTFTTIFSSCNKVKYSKISSRTVMSYFHKNIVLEMNSVGVFFFKINFNEWATIVNTRISYKNMYKLLHILFPNFKNSVLDFHGFYSYHHIVMLFIFIALQLILKYFPKRFREIPLSYFFNNSGLTWKSSFVEKFSGKK